MNGKKYKTKIHLLLRTLGSLGWAKVDKKTNLSGLPSVI